MEESKNANIGICLVGSEYWGDRTKRRDTILQHRYSGKALSYHLISLSCSLSLSYRVKEERSVPECSHDDITNFIFSQRTGDSSFTIHPKSHPCSPFLSTPTLAFHKPANEQRIHHRRAPHQSVWLRPDRGAGCDGHNSLWSPLCRVHRVQLPLAPVSLLCQHPHSW